MKKILLFVVLLFCLLKTSRGQFGWSYRGLNFTYTTDLTIYGDTIYASTYDGLYKQETNAGSGTDTTVWYPCGMQGHHVVQTFVPDYLTFICLVEIDSTNRTQNYKSTDGGNTFNLMTTDTSAANNYPFLDAMAHPSGNFNTLYLLNHRLVTFDGGLNWDTLQFSPQNDRFISVHPYYNNIIFIGGETMMLSPYLQVSYNYGGTWTFPAMNGYFAGDNSVHDITVDWQGNWWAAGEGVICMSSDSGDNWTQMLNNWSVPSNFSLYNWEIEIGSHGIYATGSNTNAMYVPFIAFSQNQFWLGTDSCMPIDSMNPEIRCLTYTGGSWGDHIFFGGHGVYVYHSIIGGIDENESFDVLIFPNPFYDNLNLHFKNGKNNSKNILTIYNSLGQIIATKDNLSILNCIDLKNISNGMYFIQITDENKRILKQFKCIKL